MRSGLFGSRTFRSIGFAIGIGAIMVSATESRNAAQQGAVTRQGPVGGDAVLMETCIGAGNALRDMSGYNARARFVGSVSGRPIRPAQLVAAGASAEAAARAYLATCGLLFGLSDPTELTVRAERRIDAKRSVVRFQQTHAGIPVLGAELVTQVDTGGNIISVSGELLPEAPSETFATIGAFEARQTALEAAAKQHGREATTLFATEPELWIYAPSLIGPDSGPSRLVWRFEVTAGDLEPIRQLVLIDATLGGVALTFNQIHTARNRLTHTANNTTTLPGTLVCNEANNTCAGGSLDAQGAHLGARDAYDFYAAFHSRDGIDNAGLTMTSTVHFDVNYQNAGWNGVQMVYGDGFGFAQADDVVGHELTHGVTQYESNLFYYYQSGAINESLSDVWGEFIDQWNGRGTDTAAVKWLMGEDVSGLGASRNMANPPAFGDPDRMLSALYHVATSDGGGVHINSGINNKAAYLMTDGGTFNGQTVTALGMTKVAKIYYEAQTNLLASGSDYIDLFDLLYQACQNLIGTSGITAADCTEVREATLAVEMNMEPAAGFHPDAPVCTTAGQVPTNVFFDGLEAGSANWTFSAATGTSRFGRNTSPYGPWAHSGVSYLYGRDDPAAITDTMATMNTSVVIPANAYMIFHHAYELEATFDGGVVEYSTDAGATWNSALSLFDFHGYPLAPLEASGNPLTGQRAFNGSSRGYLSSRLNLASLAGQSVRFRFRMGLDASIFFGGWFLDDIRIYTCNNATNVRANITSPAPSSVLTGPNVTFTWTTGTLALQYWLYVGTGGVGSANVWNQDQGLGLSRLVTGIPSGIIYVRLWTRFASGWEFNDYLYYRAAEITTPTPGSNLGASATFNWNATGAAQYWLYVGSTGVGSSNIWNQDQGTALSRLVTGIPPAATIYVRIWTRFAAIGWVFRDFTYTAVATKAVITSPAPGSVLPGFQASFIWSTGNGALRYWLYVGTAGVGSANIWNQDQGTVLSRFVTGLPVTGGTVYVRLWTLFATGWQFNDYTYIAAQRAVITSPAPSSTLPGSSPLFTWTTGLGATQYYLYVGTTGVGSSNIWNQSQGTETSRVVTGVPLTGGTIYLRLWTLFPSGWDFNDYTFTAASTVRAVLTSPAAGSVLPGASVTLGWSPGTGSLAYHVYVGSALGATDIDNQGVGLAPGTTITGIPTDGRRIYVRLWSLTSTGWFFTDYSFTASGTTRARLATPAENSVLVGPSATFTWSAGATATQYWLYVGNSPGGVEILSQNMGTALNVTVAGLPTDRRPIYVRLWSLVTGAWVYNDYVFRAFDGGGTRALISSPTEDFTLVGTTTTFNWTAGSGATQYWLYVGSTTGGSNLWNQNMGVLTSSIVTGLPTNGSTVYVRLWSLVSGVWVYNDYDYEAAP